MEEAKLQMRLHHKAIVNICDIFLEPSRRGCFVVELMRGGTVFDWVRKYGALPENAARVVFLRLIEALTYLHAHAVVHRDIKLENILLAQPNNAATAGVRPRGPRRKKPTPPARRQFFIIMMSSQLPRRFRQ